MKYTLVILVLAASTAHAQSWPADAEWDPLYCGDEPSFDPVRDDPAAPDERDIVGDDLDPALYMTWDDDFVYVRMRVDAAPTVGTDWNAFGWGMEADRDTDHLAYDLLTVVDGIADPDEVFIGENTVQAVPDDPADPVELELATYPASTHARAVLAEGMFASSFGGDDDYFVDIALPSVDIIGVDVGIYLLAFGTSSDARSLDLDLACHDRRAAGPQLVGGHIDIVPSRELPLPDTDGDGLDDDRERRLGTDPNVADSDGDGYSDGVEIDAGSDPRDPNSIPGGSPGTGGIRGGPAGCTIARGHRAPWTWWAVALMGLAVRLRRR